MDKKLKSNKELMFIIFGVILIVLISCIILYRNNAKELVMTCSIEEKTEYYFMVRTVDIYTNKKGTLYYDNIELTELTDNKKLNDVIEKFFELKVKPKDAQEIISYRKKDNVLKLMMKLDFSKYNKSTIKSFLGATDVSIEGLRNHLEGSGLICEEN